MRVILRSGLQLLECRVDGDRLLTVSQSEKQNKRELVTLSDLGEPLTY